MYMGFDFRQLHLWLLNRGWLHPDHDYKRFMDSLNGLSSELIVKSYDRALEADIKIKDLQAKLEIAIDGIKLIIEENDGTVFDADIERIAYEALEKLK